MNQGIYKADWHDCMCDDLRPVMQYLQEHHHITGWRAEAQIQQRWSRIYLNRNLSPKFIARLKEQFANSPQVAFYQWEIRCMNHHVILVSRRRWAIEHGINRQPLASFILETSLTFFFVLGGFFMLYQAVPEKDIHDIVVGLLGIIFFGLSFGLNIRSLIRHIRKK